MNKDKNYNWWEDPINKEEVQRLSWWEHPENKEIFPLPLSICKSGEYWVVAGNSDTKKYLGDKLDPCTQGKTKEEAIEKWFKMIQYQYNFIDCCRLKYQRWVPFKRGPWGHIGGKWFSIFGIHISFRYGKLNKGGWFVPFTHLNISMSNDWAAYRNYKKDKNELYTKVKTEI
jgi:hypothetical protein